jgi:hypothetical protein
VGTRKDIRAPSEPCSPRRAVVSGAGGKLDERTPTRFDDAATPSWDAQPHCLLIQVTEDRLAIQPYGGTPRGGQPRPIRRHGTAGRITDAPIVIHGN